MLKKVNFWHLNFSFIFTWNFFFYLPFWLGWKYYILVYIRSCLCSDTFNENSPPTNDPKYISSLGSSVYKAMSKADKDAVWLMQVCALHFYYPLLIFTSLSDNVLNVSFIHQFTFIIFFMLYDLFGTWSLLKGWILLKEFIQRLFKSLNDLWFYYSKAIKICRG